MNKLTALFAALALALTLGAGKAVADEENNHLTIYSAKFVCGNSELSNDDGVLAPADYFTAINIFNPNTGEVEITKMVVLTDCIGTNGCNVSGEEPQVPEEGTETDTLRAFGAVEVDCTQLEVEFNFNWAKGFLIIISDADFSSEAAPLNVVGVYTSRALDNARNVTLSVVEYTGRALVSEEENAVATGQHVDGEDEVD